MAKGNLRDSHCRPAESGQLVCADPLGRLIVLHLFQGLIKVIPIEFKADSGTFKVKDAYNMRIEELDIKSMTILLDNTSKPLLAVLNQDKVKTYNIEADKKLSQGPFAFTVAQQSAIVLAVPQPRGGLLIVSGFSFQYYNDKHKIQLSVSVKMAEVCAIARIDEDGFRYLLADVKGNLYVLVLVCEEAERVESLKIEHLGTASIASSLLYLDSGKVLVGSRFGPNQIVQLTSQRNSNGDFIQIIESQETFSPILDFQYVDVDNTGQSTLIACSGAFKEGGLTVVKRGINANILANFSLNEQPIVDIWPLDLIGKGFTSHLALSSPNNTDLISLDLDLGIVESCPHPVIMNSSSSIFVYQSNNLIIQVTHTSVIYHTYGNSSVNSERKIWMPQNGIKILCANAVDNNLVVCLNNKYLIRFEILRKELIQKQTLQIPAIPSCVTILKSRNRLLSFIGTWDPYQVLVIDFGRSDASFEKLLDVPSVPRGIKLIGDILIISFPNGTVSHGSLVYKDQTISIENTKYALIGQREVSLHEMNGSVLALSNKSCLLKYEGRNIRFLSVPLDNLTIWNSIKLNSQKDGFVAMNNLNEIIIGNLDISQNTKLNMAKIPIGETVRKLVHVKSSNVFAALSLKSDAESSGATGPNDISSLLLIDDKTFEVIDRYSLPKYETAQSIITIKTSAGEELVLLGTGLLESSANIDDCESGRLLTFKIVNGQRNSARKEIKAALLESTVVPGTVYCMAWTKSRLIANVNGRTCVYEWQESGTELGWKLLSESYGQVAGINMDTFGNFLTIGDLMRSANVLKLSENSQKLVEIARDYFTGWSTAVKFIDADHILMADDHGNLSQLVLNIDPSFVTERLFLEHVSGFHTGTVINTIIQGCLSENSANRNLFSKNFIFGTASGCIGGIGVIKSAETYSILQILQKNILAVSKTVTFIDNSEWRSFYNEKRSLNHYNHFIDGDVIQRFLSLPDELKQAVVLGGAHGCSRISQFKTVAQITELVVELSKF